MPVEVRRAGERPVTEVDGIVSRHSFSFGRHYDPANTHFGLLLASNEELVAPGAGFALHRHRDLEIVTWILEGELTHRDSLGQVGTLRPGLVQRLRAGTGVEHAEVNEGAVPVRFVQMWVRPDRTGEPPAYDQRDVTGDLAGGRLVAVASGRPLPSALSLGQRDAALLAARVTAGSVVTLPAAPYVHVFVTFGAVELAGAERLEQGDAARLRGANGPAVRGVRSAELLVWAMR